MRTIIFFHRSNLQELIWKVKLRNREDNMNFAWYSTSGKVNMNLNSFEGATNIINN